MKKLISSILSVAICALMINTTNASVLGSFLTFDGPEHHTTLFGAAFQGGGEDKLQDDSLSRFFDADSSGGFSDGDIVVSMVTLSEVNSSGVPNATVGGSSQIAILAAFRVDGTGAGGAFNLVGESGLLSSLVDASISGVAGITADTIAIVMSSMTGAVGDADPLNWEYDDMGTATTADDVIQDTSATPDGFGGSNGWSWEMTLGLTDSDDFASVVGSPISGTQRGAFSIQSHALGGGIEFFDVDVNDFAGDIQFGQVTNDFSTFGLASSDEIARGWTFRDQGTFFINAVPEPGSALIWASILGIGCLINSRRK